MRVITHLENIFNDILKMLENMKIKIVINFIVNI